MQQLNTARSSHSSSARAAAPRLVDRLTHLAEMSRALATAPDMRDLVAAFAADARRLFDAEQAVLLIHDARHQQLWTLFAAGAEPPREVRTPEDEGLAGRVLQTQESLCLSDASANPHFARRFAFQTGYVPHSMLVAPVVGPSGRRLGVIQVLDRRLDCFCDDELPLLTALCAHAGTCIEHLEERCAARRQFESFVTTLCQALDARDPLTAIHSVNVANYAVAMGMVLGLPPATLGKLRIAGLLHDVGKIGVPEDVLNKHGRLTTDEFEEMKRHAEYTREILRRIDVTQELAGLDGLAAAHHEMLDGSGYPDGLRADAIPLEARILAVADVFDALTQTRHYRGAMEHAQAFSVVAQMTPDKLDARCVEALRVFLHCDAQAGPPPDNSRRIG